MNLNNRPAASPTAPRVPIPKAVPVSPIKSPLGSVVPQAVVPVISSQGQGQYLFSGNVVPQAYQGSSISKASPSGSQTIMTPCTVYPQSHNFQGSQPRMTIFPQSSAVSQGIPGTQQLRVTTPGPYPQVRAMPQIVPCPQQRSSVRAVYPLIGTANQNLSATQCRVTPQVMYQQSLNIGTQMPGHPNSAQIRPNSVPSVKNSATVSRSSVQIIRNSVPMLVTAAPVFQTMNFPTQLNTPIQIGQSFALQNQIAPSSNIRSPILSPSMVITNPFQQRLQSSTSIALNPSQGQVVGRAHSVAQETVVSRFVPERQPQNTGTSPGRPEVRSISETDNTSLNQPAENENVSAIEKKVSDQSSTDDMTKILVKPATIIVKPAAEESSAPEDLVQFCKKEDSDLSGILSEGDTYTEMSLDSNLITDTQFCSSDEKTFLQGSPFISVEPESLITTDSVAMETEDLSPGVMSSLVTGNEMEEMLSLSPSFGTDPAQESEEFPGMEYTEMTEEVPAVADSIPQDSRMELSALSPKVFESSVAVSVYPDVPGRMEPDQEYEDSKEAIVTNEEQAEIKSQDKTGSDCVENSDDKSRSGSGELIADIEKDTENIEFAHSVTAGEVLEMKDAGIVHSNFETGLDASSNVADTFCQVCSSENSQDGAVSSDWFDQFTDDSNSITWENFHQTVLNLRAKKNEDKTDGVVENIVDQSCVDRIDSSCDKVETEVGTEVCQKEGSQVKEAAHDQSFEDEGEEPEFIWEGFLQQTGTTAVPSTAFKHVEYSLESSFTKGTKLEVPNNSDLSTFWVASVMMTCGPLLRLRYDGYDEDGSGDFWCDLNTTEVHPIGWSAQNGKNLQPPHEIRNKVIDWRSFLLESLTGARTAPSYFFEKGAALSPVDQLKCGMKLELQDALNPHQVWLVQILENVGGRLYLRLEGTQSASKHFWMFYLNHRLHPIGWAKHQEGCLYRPPKDIFDEQTEESWAEILQAALKECEGEDLPEDVFKDQQELKPHLFAVGMKLEALIPGMNMIGPATVTKVIDHLYFIVEIDDLRSPEQRESIQICCNTEYLGIFAVSWCQCKGIRLCPPRGWKGGDFVWGEYLSFCNAKAAPEKLFQSGTDDHDFERGMKLEAVNPDNPNQICAATITKIVGPLLWIHLEHMRDIPSHIEDIDSHNLFPVGWCESNNYLLKPPVKAKPRQRRTSECKTEEVYRSVTSSQTKGSWCPKIYFNHRCFSGPYLSKGRISDLPKYVGPGPLDLVLKEVLSLLVNIAYVPCRALKELQQDGPLNPNMKMHTLKAKYKGKKYKADVEVCQYECYLEEFCRNTCIKLECCPYLFSRLHVRNNCPENCQQLTKTKSNPNHVKKRKTSNFILLKPRLQQDGNAEPKKRGRKRKQFLLTQKKSHSHRNYDTNSDMKDEGFIDDYDEYGMMPAERKAYDIQTRGAKLPRYSFEKKSHRKILLTHPIQHPDKHKQGFKRLLPKVWPEEDPQIPSLVPREGSLRLESNPLHWKVSEVIQFLKTTDCLHLARIMKEQEIDGQAFLLLNLSSIQEHLELKLGPAVKLCHQIERLKVAFYENYA